MHDRPQKITFAAEKRAAATAQGFLQSGPNRNGPVEGQHTGPSFPGSTLANTAASLQCLTAS